MSLFTPGGVARNIAHNLGSLGVKVALISAIGNDAHGTYGCRGHASPLALISACVCAATAPTGAYLAVLDDKGELVIAPSMTCVYLKSLNRST